MDSHREASIRQLGRRLKRLDLRDPLVLALPRNGDLTPGILAQELDAEFDVVLARKLRAPLHPELPIGAICESGQAVVYEYARFVEGFSAGYLEGEKAFQLRQLEAQRTLLRRLRPQARAAGRSVVLVGDGNASPSTLFAILQLLAAQAPRDLIWVLGVESDAGPQADAYRPLAEHFDRKSIPIFMANHAT